jgi:hypothetical protein
MVSNLGGKTDSSSIAVEDRFSRVRTPGARSANGQVLPFGWAP